MASHYFVIPLLLILGLAVSTIWQIHVFRLAKASSTWRRTDGLVLEAYFDERRGYDSEGNDDEQCDTFSANVHYRYVIGGRTFESKRLWYRPTWLSSYSDTVDLLHGVRKGKPVDVYYDPTNPTRSVLIAGSDTSNIVAIVLRIIGLICLAYWFSRLAPA